jgi:hypothetical protein
MFGPGTIAALVSVFLTGCSGQVDNLTGFSNAAGARGDAMTGRDKASGGGEPRRVATSTNPRDFDSLDDYLAQLRWLGATGQGWYREVGPDSYELVTTIAPAPPRRTFTRAELMRQFGFTR